MFYAALGNTGIMSTRSSKWRPENRLCLLFCIWNWNDLLVTTLFLLDCLDLDDGISSSALTTTADSLLLIEVRQDNRGLRVDTGMLLFFTDDRRLLGILLCFWKMPSSLRLIAGMTSVCGGSIAVSRHGNNGPVAVWMLSRRAAAAEVGRGADGHVTSRLCACAWA